MGNKNVLETLMGAVVIIVAISFVIMTYKTSHVAPKGGSYSITAKFKEVGTLGIGSDIRIGGIRIGTVTDQHLDNDTYMAIVELTINDKVKLPKDSNAAIVSDGLLGGKYVAVEPGGDNTMLTEGDTLKFTQDAINIESLIGKFAFGGVGNDSEDSTKDHDDNGNNSQSDAIPSLGL